MTNFRQAQHAGVSVSALPMARLLVVLFLMGAVGGAQGQGAAFQQVPEFEAWIAESKKNKKDPVEWAFEKGKGEEFIFRLDVYLTQQLDAEKRRLDARKKALDAEIHAYDARMAEKTKLLLEQTKLVLAAMKTLEAQDRLGPKAVTDLNEMANSSVAEVRDLVRREFGKYIKP